MKVLHITFERLIFRQDSEPHRRLAACGKEADGYRIIAFSQLKRDGLISPMQLTEKTIAEATNSKNRWLCIFDAFRLAGKILAQADDRSQWIITCHDAFETGFVGWLASRHFGVPLHLQVHTSFNSPYFRKESFGNKIRVFAADFLLKQAEGVLVVSESIRNYAVKQLGVAARKVSVVPVFTDVQSIANATPNVSLHAELPQFDAIIFMASRLVKAKNIPIALEAMADIVKKHPRTGLVLIGSGPEEATLKELVKALRIQENVVFKPWINDPFLHYKGADIFLSTSDYEGWGMTTVEAMAAGIAVVMTNVGCAPALLEDGRNALVVPVGDRKTLCGALDALISNVDLRRRLAKAGQERAQALKDVREYPKLYAASLCKALGKNSSGREHFLEAIKRSVEKAAEYNERLIGPGLMPKIRRFLRYPFSYGMFVAFRFLGARVPMTARTFWGARMQVLQGDGEAFLLSILGITGAEEYPLVRYFIKNLQPNDVLYDIGANYGFYGVLASKFITQGEIHAFEPVPQLFACAQKNCLGKNAFVQNIAVSNESGTVEFFSSFGAGAGGVSTLESGVVERSDYAYEPLKVQAVSIDDYTKKHKLPTFMKIDVEGAEHLVIDGGRTFLTEHAPIIALEVWGGEKGRTFSKQAIDALKGLRYEPHRITSEGELVAMNFEDFGSFDEVDNFDNYIFKKAA